MIWCISMKGFLQDKRSCVQDLRDASMGFRIRSLLFSFVWFYQKKGELIAIKLGKQMYVMARRHFVTRGIGENIIWFTKRDAEILIEKLKKFYCIE